MTIFSVSVRTGVLICATLFLQGSLRLSAQAQKAQQTPAFKPVIVQMSYYAQPGMEAEVLAWRLHACDVLERLGATRGRVLRYREGPRSSGNTDHPDVIWEGEFRDRESFDRYEKIAGSDPEFQSVRDHMSTLTRTGSGRRYWEVQ
jgi:hypothetical protein